MESDSLMKVVLDEVVKQNGRMPESEKEMDYILDLYNHCKEYQQAFAREQTGLSKALIKKLGFKTTDEIKKEGFNQNSNTVK